MHTLARIARARPSLLFPQHSLFRHFLDEGAGNGPKDADEIDALLRSPGADADEARGAGAGAGAGSSSSSSSSSSAPARREKKPAGKSRKKGGLGGGAGGGLDDDGDDGPTATRLVVQPGCIQGEMREYRGRARAPERTHPRL